MDLRDLTRETEQARKAMPRADWRTIVDDLVAEQSDLVYRTDDVIEAIKELPNGEAEFGREIKLLRDAHGAMVDAEELLDTPTTGPVAVAAETEAIEYLLQARRSRGGGGSGGSRPGGGGLRPGQTDVSALALAGRSDDPNAIIGDREVAAATGRSGDEPPEELRGVLDRYFEKLNSGL